MATVTQLEKMCSRCATLLPLTEFHAHRGGKHGVRSICKSCNRENRRLTDATKREYQRLYGKKWREENRERYLERRRRYRMENEDSIRAMARKSHLKKFGLTPEQYDEMLERQGGVCACCGSPETDMHRGRVRALAVDHCHSTGRVRGLLCRGCNSALGHARECPGVLLSLLSYLEEHWAVLERA